MRTRVLTLAALCSVLAIGGAVNAQTITNGTFDTVVPSNGTGGGWTSVNIDGAGGHRTAGGNPGSFFILNNAGQAATDPTISQTITGLTIGQAYTITGDYRTVLIGQNTGATQAFGAAIDGNFLFQSAGIQDVVWRSFSFNFTAAATSAVLSLAAERNSTDNDFGVDNLAIGLGQGATAPEPGSLLLLSAGVGLAAWARRKRS